MFVLENYYKKKSPKLNNIFEFYKNWLVVCLHKKHHINTKVFFLIVGTHYCLKLFLTLPMVRKLESTSEHPTATGQLESVVVTETT